MPGAAFKVDDLTKQLDLIKSQLASTQSDLNAKTTELTGVRNSLTYANGQIDDLKTCLSGVMQMAIDLGDGYYLTAVADWEGVKVVCDRVSRSI